MDPLLNFPEFKLDVLKEIGNIGAGNAATALSILLDKPIDIGVPNVKILPFDRISEITGDPEQEVIAVFLAIEGEIGGNIFFYLVTSFSQPQTSNKSLIGGGRRPMRRCKARRREWVLQL